MLFLRSPAGGAGLLSGLLLAAESHRRRPADVFLPCWTRGRPAALDLAITAPQRQATLEEASRTPLASANAYVQFKNDFMDTHRQCAEAGVDFIPVVLETTGALSAPAWTVLAQLSRLVASVEGKGRTCVLADALRRVSMVARCCQAQSLLRRIGS